MTEGGKSIRALVSVLFLVALGLHLATENGHGQEGRPISGSPVVQASVRNKDRLPAGCALEETVQFLTGFLDAFNRGDADDLVRVFPTEVAYPNVDERGFQWYSVTDQSGNYVTYDPAELPAYFAGRHKQHERLQLLALEVAASWHPGVDLVFRVSRVADDLPLHEMNGKGAMSCDDHTIFAWSMAQDMPGEATPEA